MIVKSVLLACTRERAFELFTERAGEWWPADRRHTDDAASAIRMEASGRFFERAADSSEVELGMVRVFERPARIVLDRYPGTGPQEPTRVEITFEPAGDGTRVTVAHGAGVAGQETFGRNAPAYDRSWDLVLAAAAGDRSGAA